jgi:RNase P subunit RPR2
MAVYRRRRYLANISSVIRSPWIGWLRATCTYRERRLERLLRTTRRQCVAASGSIVRVTRLIMWKNSRKLNKRCKGMFCKTCRYPFGLYNAICVSSVRKNSRFFYEISLSSIPIKEEAWTIGGLVRSLAAFFFKQYPIFICQANFHLW